MSDTTTLHYLVIDQAYNVVTCVTSLDLSGSSLTIGDAVKGIKDADGYAPTTHLKVYRTSLKLEDEAKDNFQENVRMVIKDAKLLGRAIKLGDCNIGEEEILLVELPWRRVSYCIVDQSHTIKDTEKYLEINMGFTIDQLRRKLVEKEQDYHHIEPTSLKVYKSSLLASDEELQQKVSALLKKEKPLEEAQKLRECKIGEKEILLVELPWVTVWYRLANGNNLFEGAAMKVSAVSVSDLRLRVKDERPNDLQHVDAAKLIIWHYEPHFHINTELKFIENIKEDANATALQSNINLRDLNLSHNDMLIVQFLNPSLDKPCSPPSIPIISGKRNEQLEVKMTPSQMNSERLQELQQEGNAPHILCNRPIGLAPTIPVTLLHPILNEFQHDCESYNPQTEDYRFARALSDLSEFYSRESGRQKAFLDVCQSHKLNLQESKAGSKYLTDGSIVCNGWPCLIAEFKNEIGSNGAEPVFQTAAYYRAYLVSMRAGNLAFTCPCIGMYVAGPVIGFFGMAFTTRLNVQMLGQTVRVDYHQTADSQWTILARHLGALRQAVEKLEKLYGSKESEMTMQVKDTDKLFFPAYHRFDTDKGENTVEYISQKIPEKLLFNGKWDGKDVLIKFVQRYSMRAHELCATRGSAPKLFGCQVLKGGWTMVVMERLDESWKMVYDLMPRTKKLFEKIRNALVEMHCDGFVHGDVRDTNIMVKEEGEEYSIKLVDFDWAGIIGQTVYPRNVEDRKGLRRPEGACDTKEIKKEHDLMMLDYMFAGVVDCGSTWWLD